MSSKLEEVESLISTRLGPNKEPESVPQVEPTVVEKTEACLASLQRRKRACLGRRASPAEDYLNKSTGKLKLLQEKASDPMLSVKERRRFRAQYYALKNRIKVKMDLIKSKST